MVRSAARLPWHGTWSLSLSLFLATSPLLVVGKVLAPGTRLRRQLRTGAVPLALAPATAPAVSLVQEEDGETSEEEEEGPELKKGDRVLLHDLQSATAFNGRTGKVELFDAASERYIVWLAEEKKMMKVRARNLQRISSPRRGRQDDGASQKDSWAALGDGQQAVEGMKVVIHGLTHAKELNGRKATLRTFDFATKRYVVELKGEAPRKIRPENLKPAAEPPERLASRSQDLALPNPAAQQEPGNTSQAAASICQVQEQASMEGPLGLAPGMRVQLHGLTSSVAKQGHWNGMFGIVHCFDSKSQRYVVELPGGTPRRIKPGHLTVVGPEATSPAEDTASAPSSGSPSHHSQKSPPTSLPVATVAVTAGHQTVQAEGEAAISAIPRKWKGGSRVRLVNLKKASTLNGKVGVVLKFEERTQRYIVQLPDGTTKRIRGEHLVPAVEQADAPGAVPTPPPPPPRYSVCNAYTEQASLQVFAIPEGEQSGHSHHKYVRVVRDLPFQDCSDVQDIPFSKGSLAFAVGRMEVARIPFNTTEPTALHGLELTVFRSDVNKLKASVHQNAVNLEDSGAYYLHVVNAYAGSKLLELRVKRGAFTKTLPLDTTYRLNRYAPITLMLTDGFRRLKLGFQPQAGKTYCVVTTGTDPGFHGEPRNVGLLAHELGAWTASEEMPGEGHTTPAPAAHEEEAPMDAGPDASASASASPAEEEGGGADGQGATDAGQGPADAEAEAAAAEAEAEAEAAGAGMGSGAEQEEKPPAPRKAWFSGLAERIVGWAR